MYIQLVKVLYYKLPNIGKQLPTSAHKARGLNCQPKETDPSLILNKVQLTL